MNKADFCVIKHKTDQKHLISKSELRELGIKVKMIESLGELQIRNVSEIGESEIFYCNQFHNDLPIFKQGITVILLENSELMVNGHIIDTPKVSRIPILNHRQAAKITHENLNLPFCYLAELGYYLPTSWPLDTDITCDLVWKISNKPHGYPYSIVSATTGETYLTDDGIVQ